MDHWVPLNFWAQELIIKKTGKVVNDILFMGKNVKISFSMLPFRNTYRDILACCSIYARLIGEKCDIKVEF